MKFAALAMGFGLGACSTPALAPLPEAATATGVHLRSAESESVWSVHLAAAEGGIGAPILATATTVARAESGRPPLQVVADRSEWNLRERTASFEQNVVVTRGDVKLDCSHLDVRYARGEQIESIVATGNVIVRKGEREATADRAELDGATGRVTLTGNPRLREGESELWGAVITLWLDDERANCEGAAGQACRLVVAGSAIGP